MKQSHKAAANAMLDWVEKIQLSTGNPPLSGRVLQAMRHVPRHLFVPEELLLAAYTDMPLPIGYGQTISQPYIVALMTSLIDPKADDHVLEIGTGSGYQAAILSQLAGKVFSVERIPQLFAQADERLKQLGIDNIELRAGDGHNGWPEHAPYDSIIVTAAAAEIPAALIEQLKPGGKLVIPVRTSESSQSLRLVKKDQVGNIWDESILPVTFVPLRGGKEDE